jgi:hypothetical protein
MKPLLFGLVFVALSGALSARGSNVEILNDEGFHSDDWSHLEVADVSGKDYLASIQDNRHYDAIADQVHDMNGNIRGRLEEFCQDEFNASKGGKTLKITMDLTEFNPGSTAAAVWVGFGAGSGHCVYEVHFWDHDKDVASFTVRATIQRLVDATGGAGRARVPSVLVQGIRSFLQSH